MSLTRMRDQHRRIFLKHTGDRDHGNFLLDEVQRNERVRRNADVELAGGQKLRMIYLRPALADRDV